MAIDAFILHSKRITTVLFLHAAYYFGIGFTAVISRFFRVSFFSEKPKHTSWVKHEQSNDLTNMY